METSNEKRTLILKAYCKGINGPKDYGTNMDALCSDECCGNCRRHERLFKEEVQKFSETLLGGVIKPTNNMSDSKEMPKYKSHKVVWALKIKDLLRDGEGKDESDGGAVITPEEEGFAPFVVDYNYMRKHQPKVGGYYVKYKDGYESFSPADVFEEGNTLIVEGTGKTLDNTSVEDAKQKVSDIKVFGNGDLFQLLSKASSESQGWMESTKAMQTPFGCVVQVTTQQKNMDMSWSISDAVTFVPGVWIQVDGFGNKYLGERFPDANTEGSQQ